MTQKWDRHSIKAELARRGYTLTGLALEHGLHESACRRALHSTCLSGAQVIAKVLGVEVKDLFPDRYLQRRRQSATPTPSTASPKCASASDMGEAA